ncbi:hypothetical protein [Chitinophaga sp. Cy-1792]|uniref:hypothetical protein n=1 Tax=Chitinophaga sp. Cy-1792 TaxID=2608339 RepID=UPI001422BCD2|nr:hypothetical protein [Chitinophaga sp. Cy-1792]NIG52236.1 hypothetical protein [Chitinophaga sp. Cy-1792]
MRSIVGLMACIGCIAWVHSCEKRILGVQIGRPYEQSIPTLVTPGYSVENAAPVIARVNNTIHPSPQISQVKKKSKPGKSNSSYLSTAGQKFPHTLSDSALATMMVIKQTNPSAITLTP